MKSILLNTLVLLSLVELLILASCSGSDLEDDFYVFEEQQLPPQEGEAVKINGIYYLLYPSTNSAIVTRDELNFYKYEGNMVVPTTVKYGSGTFNVTGVDHYAFANCKKLTSVTLPNGIETIGNYAFFDCNELKHATMSNGIKAIGNYAFYRCSRLEGMSLPSSIQSIGKDSFTHTKFYQNAQEGLLYIGDIMVGVKGDLKGEVIVRDGTRLLCDMAFAYQSPNIVLPSSLTCVGCDSFYRAYVKTVICHATTPPALMIEYPNLMPPSTILYVPKASVEAYKNAEGWKLFGKIEPMQ